MGSFAYSTNILLQPNVKIIFFAAKPSAEAIFRHHIRLWPKVVQQL